MASSTAAAAAQLPTAPMDFQRCITEGRKPPQRGGHASILAGNRLIVFGGHRYEKDSKFTYFNDVFMLDIDTLHWKEIYAGGSAVLPRYGHSATLIGSRIFIFGGRGEEGLLFRDVQVLDLKQWLWAPVTSQSVGPSPRMNHAMALVGRKIVIHGGWNGTNSAFDDLWVFDTDSFAWMQPKIGGLAPSPRYGHSLTLLNDGRLMLFGGACMTAQGLPDYHNDLRELDTETMVWSRTKTVGNGPSARQSHTTSLVGDQLVIYGGWGVGGLQTREENARHGAESLYLFDTKTGAWKLPQWLTQTMPHKYGHTTSVMDSGCLVVFGGWDGKQALNEVLITQVVGPGA